MQELTFFHCKHCGNVAFKAYDMGPSLVCCGEKMEALSSGVTDAAREKHVPVIEVKDGIVTVTIGSVMHPMIEEHHIAFIAAMADGIVFFKNLLPGDEPKMTFKADGPVTAYEYCNLHGLWKGEN